MISDGRYPDYPLFKGLQRPLELMGLQGRYIYWAAGVAGGAIVGFIAAYCLMGFVAGLVVLATVLSAGNRAYHPQTAKRAAQQKCKTWSVCVCLFAQSMTIRKTITAMCVAD